VLAWIVERCAGRAEAVETPIGLVPAEGALDTSGLDLAPEALRALLTVDEDGVKAELPQTRDHLEQFGDDLPPGVARQLEQLVDRLG
jgi:phosphoenolpyruvate carboxykinase (GTP)